MNWLVAILLVATPDAGELSRLGGGFITYGAEAGWEHNPQAAKEAPPSSTIDAASADISVRGALPVEKVRQAALRRHPELDRCAGLRPRSFTLEFDVAASGVVEKATAVATPADKVFEACVVASAGQWLFERPADRKASHVRLPLTLTPIKR